MGLQCGVEWSCALVALEHVRYPGEIFASRSSTSVDPPCASQHFRRVARRQHTTASQHQANPPSPVPPRSSSPPQPHTHRVASTPAIAMGNTAEQQAAFAAFDFAGSAAWRDYFNNLTIPPDRVNDPAVLRRYRQKFFRQCVDSDFQVDPLQPAASPASATPPASSAYAAPSSASTAPRPSASGRASAAGTGASGATGGTGSSSSSRTGGNTGGNAGGNARMGLQTYTFVAHAWVVTMALVALFPLCPRALLVRAFRFALFGGLVASALSILQRHGRPAALSLPALKSWLQTLLTGPHLLTLMHCSVFLPSPHPIALALLPLAARSLLPLTTHLQQNFSQASLYRSYLSKPCEWVSTNRQQVELFTANTEVMLGPLLAFYLLTPQRSFFQVFLYWQLLKMRFHAPASAWYHRQIWGHLETTVLPHVQRYVPMLMTPIGYVQRWFQSMGRA
ncbi:unnamed protein product [Closterium sp. Naga37s-1]|nr:unnamed protein product [Closterium sp. Naga37s-1]